MNVCQNVFLVFFYSKGILDDCGLSYIWHNQSFSSISSLKRQVFHSLLDQFSQSWRSIFNERLQLENYLLKLPFRKCKLLCRFRCCNFKLPIETGRWNNTPRSERKHNICNTNDSGDEFHYLFKCKDAVILEARNRYLPRSYCIRPNVLKFDQLFKGRSQSFSFRIYFFQI